VLKITRSIEYYLLEKYLKKRRTHFSRAESVAYNVLPQSVRNFIFKTFIRFKMKLNKEMFPKWPIDTTLVNKNEYKKTIKPWPRSIDGGLLLTHDVDRLDCVKNIEKIRKVERQYDMKSTWNFVADKSYIDKIGDVLTSLCSESCEIGCHSIKHDGTLFSNRKKFIEKIKEAHYIFSCMGFDNIGFRSPLLFRRAEWMEELSKYYEYDSSFIDTEIFSPYAHRSGCLAWHPFFIGKLLEIPITMPLDYTLFSVLSMSNREAFRLWKMKADEIIKRKGLICILTHPDFTLISNPKRIDVYNKLLSYLSEKNLWVANGLEISKWWKHGKR
jgi:peptidoglycan/xylan/chitin deacetylase (PgdA/CDA1 family)